MESIAFTNKSILLFGLDEDDVRIITDELTPLGCRIVISNSVERVIGAVESGQADALVIDSEPNDIEMDKFTSVIVASKIQGVPIIILSDGYPVILQQDFFNFDLTDFVVRPFRGSEVSFRLNTLLVRELTLRRKAVVDAGFDTLQQMIASSPFSQAVVHCHSGNLILSSPAFYNEFCGGKVFPETENWLAFFGVDYECDGKIIRDAEKHYDREVSFVGVNGHRKSGTLRVSVLEDVNPQYVMLSLDARCDSDELQEKVDMLKRRLYELAKMLELPLVIFSENQDTILHVNPKFTGTYGYTLHDMPTLKALFKRAYPKNVWYDKAVRSWERLKNEVFNNDGAMVSIRDFDMFSKSAERRRVRSFVAKYDGNFYWIPIDITSEVEYQQEVKLFSEAVRQSPAGITFTNQLGYLTYVNPMFTSITGYDLRESMGHHPVTLLKTKIDTQSYDAIWETLRKGEVWHGEFVNQKKSGEQYWEKSTIAPILNDRGMVTHFMSIHEDVTSEKEMVEKLIVSERALKEANSTKDKLLSIVGHDLRNPIGAIINLAAIVLRDCEICAEGKNYVELIKSSAINSAALLEDLLNWARSQSGRLVVMPDFFSLKDEIGYAAGAIAEMARGKSISLLLGDDPMLMAFGDRNLFHTVVRNLLSNAVKFTPNGGRVEVAFFAEDDVVKVMVMDNGIGIEPERINDLFKAGKNYSTSGTVNEYGTGLGLPLAGEFVARMGGKIWIESLPGKGTTVTFTLPATPVGL